MTQDNPAVEVLSSTTRLPPFLSSDTKLWFLQAEAIFTTERITSQTTKFNRVIAVLPPETLRQVADLLATPGTDPYDAIKERIHSTYTRSESKSLQLLLDNPPIGDQRPSQLLNEMRYIAGSDIPSSLLCKLWINRLPQSCRSILAASAETDPSKLAAIADRIMETADTIATNSVQHQISELSAQIQQLSAANSRPQRTDERRRSRTRSPPRRQLRQRSRDRNYERSRSQSRSRSRSRSVCWYHDRWGNNAVKCEKPCNYRSEN
uniref:DUF7041 domain-containing protein n=1 Tax=Lygus hesperus TaxID=30085 RepID=A0A0K8SB41_LYGHE